MSTEKASVADMANILVIQFVSQKIFWEEHKNIQNTFDARYHFLNDTLDTDSQLTDFDFHLSLIERIFIRPKSIFRTEKG